MRKVWVVVANRSDSKIYRAENVNTLVEHKSLTHKEAHLNDHDLIADGPGRTGQKGVHGSDTLSEKTTQQDKEAKIFATEIASFLEQGYNSGECERVYLVAKAPFLGFLRESLHPNVVKMVESEIHKDIVDQRPEQIREYLPPVL